MSKPLSILRSFFGYTLFLINILVAGWLLLCLYASVTSPEKNSYLALLSLTIPFAIIANLVFVFIWIFSRHKWRIGLSTLTLVCCYKLIAPVFGFHFFSENKMEETLRNIKVMTWNMHGLGIYDRPRDKNKPEKMFELIQQENPDILSMVEYYTKSDGSNAKAIKFFKKAGYREYRFTYDNTLGVEVFVGNAVFSKYPLSNFMETDIAENIKMMQCDVALPGDKKMRLFIFHLQSFMLGDKDKAIIEEVKVNTNKIEQKADYSKAVTRKFRKAYVKRAQQAELVKQKVLDSPYPVIICADLNDVPASYTYTAVKGNLKDAFAEKGRGMSRTYNFILPTLRIDYIFYDPAAFHIMGYKSIVTGLSDHNPVIANFEMVSGTR